MAVRDFFILLIICVLTPGDTGLNLRVTTEGLTGRVRVQPTMMMHLLLILDPLDSSCKHTARGRGLPWLWNGKGIGPMLMLVLVAMLCAS